MARFQRHSLHSSLLLVVALAICYGANDRQVGCVWLTIPVGTREAALAGAGTATSLGPQGIFYNPAATANTPPFAAQVEYTKWFLDTHHQSLFIARDFRHFALGLGAVSFASGKFDYREEIPTEEPLATFSPLDLTGYINIARCFAPWANAGISARYFYSKVLNNELSGFGFDIGARFKPRKNLSAGIAVVDFGRTLSYKYQLIWLPTRLRCGIGYNLPFGKNSLLFVADGSYFFYSQKFQAQLGTEFRLGDILSLRTGYDPLNPGNRLNFGIGVAVNRFRFDYTFAPLGFGLGTAHRFGVAYGIAAAESDHQ
ncbi:MAG: PorV/PorQ family protein [candidate division WOR-3 bacterium]|nr:PorV/PorQ family protein [candidate division WOR-3 bacterium]MDH7518318.1 PorV/PorQ family protein [bacterium]